MQVGIIAEGWSDVAVIRNILKGWLGVDKSDTQPLLPGNQVDETSRHTMEKNEFSNWTLVKQACISGEHHSKFLEFQEEGDFVVVHLDTDMRKEIGFDVPLPVQVNEVTTMDELISNVEGKLRGWLKPEFASKTVFAIAVEETEAWILTLFSTENETGLQPSAKEHLFRTFQKSTTKSKTEKQEILRATDPHIQYTLLSYDLRKRKELVRATKRNRSLALFCEGLSAFAEEEM